MFQICPEHQARYRMPCYHLDIVCIGVIKIYPLNLNPADQFIYIVLLDILIMDLDAVLCSF